MRCMERDRSWVSDARFAPFLKECHGQEDLAWELYEWNAKVAAALFECFHHAEVLLRNAMMRELEKTHPLDYPWQIDQQSIVKAAARRRDSATDIASPDAVISEITLGFWETLLEGRPQNEALWRKHLHRAFPGSPRTRKPVYRAVADMRRLRNRCAHMDSLLNFDPRIELRKLLTLVEWIDPAARDWLVSIETVTEVARQRPKEPDLDVVVVGASAEQAVAMYDSVAAYVCPGERSFAEVRYMGFYADQKILPYFARIEDIKFPPRWNKEEAEQLRKSDDPQEAKLGRVMGYALNHGWSANEQWQIFLLSEKKSDETIRRREDAPIVHLKRGRGSAFVRNKRYFAKAAVKGAATTDELR